jgi:hypothetical protein
LGLSQLQGLQLDVPEIFVNAMAELQTPPIDFARLKSIAPLAVPGMKFVDAWWLDENGSSYIPRSVSSLSSSFILIIYLR